MLDLQRIRSEPERVRANLARRKDPAVLQRLDAVVEADRAWRSALQKAEALRRERNALTRAIQQAKAGGKDAAQELEQARVLAGRLEAVEKKARGEKERLQALLLRLPNLLHEDVPEGKDDQENVEVRRWGRPGAQKAPAHHGRLAARQGWADFERAVKISGSGFYFLTGDLVLLELALQRFALDFLVEKGFVPVAPPLMMRKAPYEGMVDLEDFETVMYRIDGEDQYLIATSEHPIGAMHAGEILRAAELPLKYAGVSACFRREIGKHGIDERGLFRVHQFNKVEQFVFCEPEASWELHEALLQNAETLLQRLELPYRVVNVCTGDIGAVAAKKYDIEAWSPREQKYIEVVSCSNCTDYQARRLRIRVRRGSEKVAAHTLNSTALATARTLRVLLETFQDREGAVAVPRALRPYLGGRKALSPRAPVQSG